MPTEAVNGLLPVDKPEGPTSHDVVGAARRALGLRRVGHTGTLDPFASGLLLLLAGPATRLAEYFDHFPKTYRARMRLGIGTDTDDLTGTVIAETEVAVDDDDVRVALNAQVGTRLQRPPAFSAKKVAGRRAYAAARAGAPMDLDPVPVRIDSLRLVCVDGPYVDFEVTCGAGTYIRAIARDAGEALGLPAHLVELRRTAIGPWVVGDATPLSDLADRGRDAVLPAIEALAHLPRIDLDPEEALQVSRGGRPAAPADAPAGPIALISKGRLLAIGEVLDGRLAPRKVFLDA